MITHVAMFRWKDEPQDSSARLAAALPAMMAEIGEVSSFEFGADLGRLADGYHFVLVVRVPDEEALRRYEEHAAHQRVIGERVNPALDQLALVQFAS